MDEELSQPVIPDPALYYGGQLGQVRFVFFY